MQYRLNITSELKEDFHGPLGSDAMLGAGIGEPHIRIKDPDLYSSR